jgi:hypothetical protein
MCVSVQYQLDVLADHDDTGDDEHECVFGLEYTSLVSEAQ